MDIEKIKDMYCAWCPKEQECNDSLTLEEKRGCQACGGFADALIEAGYCKPDQKISCKYEDWDDTTLPHPVCHCVKREGVDCANVPDDVASCPDFEPSKGILIPDQTDREAVIIIARQLADWDGVTEATDAQWYRYQSQAQELLSLLHKPEKVSSVEEKFNDALESDGWY